MRLYDYYGKNVAVICKSGRVIHGVVNMYTPAIDDPDERENISILPYPKAGFLIDIYEDEIKSIIVE